ncbi:MAG: phosphoethanolamine transferase [Bacteroidales bacterium]|nr:phosphoethanolamine transferase [Bacteroidales bacterium]
MKKAAMGAVNFLARPFTTMWAFTLGMLMVYLCLKYGVGGDALQLKYVVPELLTLALALSLLKGRWRTAAEWIVIVGIGLLSAVELWLHNHFRLTLSCQALQLLMETNSREASEFASQFVYTASTLKYALMLALGYAIAAMLHLRCTRKWVERTAKTIPAQWSLWLKVGAIVGAAVLYFVRSGWVGMQPRMAYALLSSSVGEYEQRFIKGEGAGGCGTCTPLSRLMHGMCLYSLTRAQCDELIGVLKRAKIDGCDYRSSNLMLLIGESFIKRHAQIYGYALPTTPRMMAEMEKGNLVRIDDAITMVARTSDVFKEMLSMHSIDQAGSWSSVPMMPHLFRLAGYRVSLISNQYARSTHDVWNTTGAFFLENPEVSRLLVDYHNPHTYRYDEGLLHEVDSLMRARSERNLVMLHVRGQHVKFENGYPENRAHFSAADYGHRSELSQEQKREVAHYDNCTLYQDSIAGALFDRYRHTDMVIVMVSDHGENVYDDGHTLGRSHNHFSRAMLESQYQVPMWIWCSDKYRTLHPHMVERIKAAQQRPFETDDISHLMLDLAGIRCPYFEPKRSLIDDHFDSGRKRLVGDAKHHYERLLKR